PPIEEVAAQRRDDEGDGEMHAHGVERMARDRDGRRNRLAGHLLDDGIADVAGFVHRRSPLRKASAGRAGWFRGRHFFLAPALFAMPLVAGFAGPLSALAPEGPA